MSEKKTVIEKGKFLSNFMKVVSIGIVLTVYTVAALINGNFMGLEEVKGLFLVGFYVYAPFLTIDVSLIIKNIFGVNK